MLKKSLNGLKPLNGLKQPVVYNAVKRARLAGASGKDALLAGGYAETSALHRVGVTPLLRVVDAEIAAELASGGLTKRAYGTLRTELQGQRAADRIAAATAILRFTAGEIVHQRLSVDEEAEYSRIRGEMGTV